MRVPISLHLQQYLWSIFFIIAIQEGMQRHLTVALMGISLMTLGVGLLFMDLLANLDIFFGEMSNQILCGTSLVDQCLRLCASNAGGAGSIPGRGTKIPQATWRSQKAKNNNKKFFAYVFNWVVFIVDCMSFYILWIKVLYQINDLQIFSLIL